MGLFDVLGGLFGGAASAGASFASAKALQEDAQQYATSFYKQRYQRQMEDMRAAGLNPILSYRTGAPGTGGGTGIASAGAAAASGAGAVAATSQAVSAKGLRAEQITTERSKQELLKHQARQAEATAKLTNVNKSLAITGLPKAQHQSNFYEKVGHIAVPMQEGGHSAKSVIPFMKGFTGGRR